MNLVVLRLLLPCSSPNTTLDLELMHGTFTFRVPRRLFLKKKKKTHILAFRIHASKFAQETLERRSLSFRDRSYRGIASFTGLRLRDPLPSAMPLLALIFLRDTASLPRLYCCFKAYICRKGLHRTLESSSRQIFRSTWLTEVTVLDCLVEQIRDLFREETGRASSLKIGQQMVAKEITWSKPVIGDYNKYNLSLYLRLSLV
jgi:hypothetical protein